MVTEGEVERCSSIVVQQEAKHAFNKKDDHLAD